MARDDVDIMRRVQSGEHELFNELVLRYHRPLLAVAYSKLGDAALAEDVVQEAFLAAFAARHTYKPEFSFRTWLWTILINLCRSHGKKQSRRPNELQASAGLQPLEEIAWQMTDVETGLSHLLVTEQKQILAGLLRQLPEVQADALRLRFFGGLKFDEIARAMNCSLNGAKMRVKNGLLRLAKLFRDQEEDAL